MKNEMNFGIETDVEITRNTAVANALPTISTTWEWEQYRDGVLIDTWKEKNIVTNEGINAILDIMFSDGTQITDWYVTIYSNSYTPASNNTYATPGFTETALYDETTRPAWVEAGVSGKALTNTASKAVFTMNDTVTVYGGALVGGGTAATTKSDAAGGGKVFCISNFTASKPVTSGDVLNVTLSVSAAAT